MKTKQKEEKAEDEPAAESSGKTRARKKLSLEVDEDRSKNSQETEPDKPKETAAKKRVVKKGPVGKKRPLGITKTLRSKKTIITKDKVKAVIKQVANKRGRKPARKPEVKADPKEAEKPPIIPPSEIKKEPVEEPTSNSRSSSPKTSGPRRQRLTSDMQMMRSALADSPTSLLLGSRTSPYAMRSERSNSPFRPEATNLRSGRSRKLKNNLLNEIVKNEQKKKRRLGSEKADASPDTEEAKKLKRGRSRSRDSKCSDATESDLSLCDASGDIDKPDKDVKTELDIDEESLALPPEVPAPPPNCKSEESGSSFNLINSGLQSLKRSTSLDSDNNNRMKVADVPTGLPAESGDKKNYLKTENVFAERNSILTNMSKTFNTKEMTKNIRKARRGRKASTIPKGTTTKVTALSKDKTLSENQFISDPTPDDSFSKEINDLIETLGMCDVPETKSADPIEVMHSLEANSKILPKTFDVESPTSLTLALPSPQGVTEAKTKLTVVQCVDNKEIDESENIRLRIEDSEDSQDKVEESTKENLKAAFKPSTQDIDKLMDKLKHFEELDKKRQQEQKAKESVMVNAVVLIPKSGAEIKPLKDIQATISSDKPVDKGNLLSCFQNNSAISIVTKRDHVRKSVDVDLPNSITLIKRNSSSRKESTGSNSGDTISIIEKSLGKDVTLTELRRSIDKPTTPSSEPAQTLHQLATIQPNKPGTVAQSIAAIIPNPPSTVPQIIAAIIPNSPSTVSQNIAAIISNLPSTVPQNVVTITTNPPTVVPHNIPMTISPSIVVHNIAAAIIQPPTIPAAIIQPATIPAAIIQPATVIEEKPQTNGNDVPKHITKSRDSVSRKSLEVMNSPTEKIKPEQIVKSPKSEPMKSPLRIVKSPPLEIISVQTSLPDMKPLPKEFITSGATTNVLTISPPAMTVSNVFSTDLPKDIIINADKSISIPSITTLVSTDVKLQPVLTPVKQQEIKIVSQAENLPKEESSLMKSPPPIIVKIPSPEALKEKITSPRTDESKPKSENKSPHKVSTSPKETPKLPSPAKTAAMAEQCTAVVAYLDTNAVLTETPERQKRKESILRTLGLLTLKAADEAKMEKQKQKEMYASKGNKSMSKMHSGESSGTLKTVIKLNRGLNTDKKSKSRSSLKMTFQKAKVRAGKPFMESGEISESDDTYYTIHNKEGATMAVGSNATGGHRTSHNNRFNTHDGMGPDPSESPEPAVPKEATLNLVIPEKASSFSIHPGRLCQDQCFYCGGNFGLFDTPCHIAQMKSADRQKKVLDNEEKLTMDSCLCDACYRHVDRRANCPSYRKRPNLVTKPPLSQFSASMEPKTPDESSSDGKPDKDKAAGGRPSVCHAAGCSATADHSIRRKWLIKMRNSVNKVVKLELDYPGLHTIPLCSAHYRPVSQLMLCGLCRRRINKHHNIHFINQAVEELNPRLTEQGLPVTFSERPAVCKLCRCYCTLLFQPGQQQNKRNFLKMHRRRLLQTYGIEVPEDSEPEATVEEPPKEGLEEDPNFPKQKKKSKTGKSKQRKSTETVKPSQVTVELHQELEPGASQADLGEPMDEDIESLISSNKISKGPDVNVPSDNSEPDTLLDIESTVIPSFDKQSELQYLLQKQNNPAQFLQPVPNLTQKQRNVLKAHNASAIQKPATTAKIVDKNAKRIQKLGLAVTQKEGSKPLKKDEDVTTADPDKAKETVEASIVKNITLTDECTIESIPPKKSADISVLKNKWQMSESFTQVKKNLSELSKNVPNEKSTKKSSDTKYSNPVRRLETNPSISVRELFPGEDEMNLQGSIEFNNVKGVTPEGWEKCNATIQYDVETKKLWNELQKPYGNQSSFLRHLVLLEKYFRSGDLVLSQNANGNAVNYSDSVQSRLRAYDNVPEPPRRSPAVSLIEFRKQKPSSGKSLLKSNQSLEITPKQAEPKLPSGKSPEPAMSLLPNYPKAGFPPNYPGATPPAVFAKPKSRPSPSTSAMLDMRPPGPKQKSQPPPELISIHTPTAQGRKSIENVLKNIQQLVKGVSAPEPAEMVAGPVLPPPSPQQPPPLPPPPQLSHKEPGPKKQKTTTKPWRPTLMPITQENLTRIAREPTQLAVDGRALPSLVQVMSGGQRYHITLADYNKMCIMRREKLQQVQVVENSSKKKAAESSDASTSKKKVASTTEVVTEIYPSATHGNGGTVTQNLPAVEPSPTKSDEVRNAENSAANILKNVGLKNITIAPVIDKPKATATVTTLHSPAVSTSSLTITTTPMKMPQLGSAVTITSDTLISPGMSIGSQMLPQYSATIQPLVMPKIPKSLTVIPQMIPVSSSVINMPTMSNLHSPMVNLQQSMVNVPSSMVNVPSPLMNIPTSMVQSPMVNVPPAMVNVHSSMMNMPQGMLNVPPTMMNIPSSMVNVPSSTVVSVPVSVPMNIQSYPGVAAGGVAQP